MCDRAHRRLAASTRLALLCALWLGLEASGWAQTDEDKRAAIALKGVTATVPVAVGSITVGNKLSIFSDQQNEAMESSLLQRLARNGVPAREVYAEREPVVMLFVNVRAIDVGLPGRRVIVCASQAKDDVESLNRPGVRAFAPIWSSWPVFSLCRTGDEEEACNLAVIRAADAYSAAWKLAGNEPLQSEKKEEK